jgi:CDP-6-deoxy-D-xylo-4-hexulose-3-dehydrase
MVNSGSSANLLAASILSNARFPRRLAPGDEVIVPAVAWSTTYFPLAHVGAVPVLVDVNLETFTIDPGAAEAAVTARTRALLPVHLLGNPCDMERLLHLAQRRDLFLIEDACEAHGAQFNGRMVGSFGNIGTFSFYFSHHISTIEGGMLVTSDDRVADLARVLRAHGWQRDMKTKVPVSDSILDPRYLFVNLGYNLRPTELQGAFGVHQVGKLEGFIRTRRENAEYWNSSLQKYSDWLLLSSGVVRLPDHRPPYRTVLPAGSGRVP